MFMCLYSTCIPHSFINELWFVLGVLNYLFISLERLGVSLLLQNGVNYLKKVSYYPVLLAHNY